MIRFKPTMPRSNSIGTPDCPQCGTGMRLFGIEVDDAGDELLSFDCPRCQHIETMIRKSNTPQFSSSH
jgi:predicted RNA-binding Zn-ribbon protein involved in translation (DUF1610 family)